VTRRGEESKDDGRGRRSSRVDARDIGGRSGEGSVERRREMRDEGDRGGRRE
jgi:hypothetical protein